ncbi:uncharacterized protein TNCV_3360461 [Trichonephila clavipes]|nr:uncharacterized protein TNCV_3360461 [Trichonephila clavipes]
MPSDPIFQHFLEVFFPYSYMEASDLHMVLVKDITPKGPLTKNLFYLIADTLDVLDISIHDAWSGHIGKERRAMMQSVKFYVWHVISMCWVEKLVVADIYDRTLSVVALVRFVSEMFWFTSGKKLYQLNSRILTVFFENSLKEDFKKRGGWKRLEKHILNRKYKEYHNKCAAYRFVFDAIPDDLKLEIRQSLVSRFDYPKELHSEKIDDLTQEVMSSIGFSLLNEINSPKINEGKSVSKEAEGSSSNKANVLKDSEMPCDGTSSVEADALKDSDMPRSSEKQINLCVSRVNQLEEKLKDLISIFELLETGINENHDKPTGYGHELRVHGIESCYHLRPMYRVLMHIKSVEVKVLPLV